MELSKPPAAPPETSLSVSFPSICRRGSHRGIVASRRPTGPKKQGRKTSRKSCHQFADDWFEHALPWCHCSGKLSRFGSCSGLADDRNLAEPEPPGKRTLEKIRGANEIFRRCPGPFPRWHPRPERILRQARIAGRRQKCLHNFFPNL